MVFAFCSWHWGMSEMRMWTFLCFSFPATSSCPVTAEFLPPDSRAGPAPGADRGLSGRWGRRVSARAAVWSPCPRTHVQAAVKRRFRARRRVLGCVSWSGRADPATAGRWWHPRWWCRGGCGGCAVPHRIVQRVSRAVLGPCVSTPVCAAQGHPLVRLREDGPLVWSQNRLSW